MKLINVRTLEEASLVALDFLPENTNLNLKVAFTGGRFGEELIKNLAEREYNLENWTILQTDERVSCGFEDLIQTKIINELSECKGFCKDKLILFPFEENYLEEISAFEEHLYKLEINRLDLCFLSMGEDGHMAGHFNNSKDYKDSIFCFNTNSPKPPKTRLSFKVSWLMKANRVILVSFGKEKHKELKKLLGGSGLHSQILRTKELIIISDLLKQDF